MWYNWRPGRECWGRNFNYTTAPAILSRVFAKIIIFLFFPKCLTFGLGCAIIIVSGGDEMELTREEKQTIQKVVEHMGECDLFSGRYDAKNGNKKFMYGVSLVMEYLAYLVSEEYGEEFDTKFVKNMAESEKKCLTDNT
jgi:hypothetical protein